MNSSSGLSATLVVDRLRPMFYLVPWWEMKENVLDTKNERELVGDATFTFFGLMFVELVIAFFIYGVKLYRSEDFYASISSGAVQQLTMVYQRGFITAMYIYLWEHFHLVDLTPNTWYEWLLCMLAVDCSYYWMHRHAHEYHFFWVGHSVHHTGEDFNLATALRQGIIQGWASWVWRLPLVFVFSPVSYFVHAQLNTLYQFWIHTTLIGSLGPLELIMNTPSHHRMHHRPPGNRNYAGVLIVWDRMFGTFEPEDEQKDYYGLAKQVETFDPVAMNYEHWKRMVKNMSRGKVKSLGFYLNLITKRRIKHKAVFNPMALLEGIPAPKQSLWNIPKSSKRLKFSGTVERQGVIISANVLIHFLWAMATYVYAFANVFNKDKPWLVELFFTGYIIALFVVVAAYSRSFAYGLKLQALLGAVSVYLALVPDSKVLVPGLNDITLAVGVGESILLPLMCIARICSRTPANVTTKAKTS